MPEVFYEEMDKMFEELGIELEDTDDKERAKDAGNFIATFTPEEKPIVIVQRLIGFDLQDNRYVMF